MASSTQTSTNAAQNGAAAQSVGGNIFADFSMNRSRDGRSGVIANLLAKTVTPGGKAVAAGTASDSFGNLTLLGIIDNVIGSSFNDFFYGNAKANIFAGLRGRDAFFGGAGIDTADYSLDGKYGAKLGIVVNLSNASVAIGSTKLAAHTARDGFGDIDTLDSIERIIGTMHRDVMVGSTGNDYFIGLWRQ